ncbi:hypothetical protein TIFTF001_042536 [Ficus carica]|uniref:Uncharacterized protein n=1 Tax=Ficus carica TaxID=3494 RepID=A0AA88DFM7_FICCA|nr:hypothetical protein TIFTF001_042536 [Ficus carica]
MAAAEGMFKYCFYEGCIAGGDTGIERRPYHRNCSCALHKSRKSSTSATSATAAHCASHGLPRSKSVSFPIRKSWSEGCLAFHAAAAAGSPAQSSPSASSPAVVAGGKSRRLGSFDEEDEDCVVFFKV